MGRAVVGIDKVLPPTLSGIPEPVAGIGRTL